MADPNRKRLKYEDVAPPEHAPAHSLVILTLEQLKDAMREVMREEREQGGTARLASRKEICRALRVSTHKLDDLVKEGLPVVRLGSQTPRFDVADCVHWLKAREEAESKR